MNALQLNSSKSCKPFNPPLSNLYFGTLKNPVKQVVYSWLKKNLSSSEPKLSLTLLLWVRFWVSCKQGAWKRTTLFRLYSQSKLELESYSSKILPVNCKFMHGSTSVPIKLIFFSKSAFLLDTCRFIFDLFIVKHAKTVDFWAHADTPKS